MPPARSAAISSPARPKIMGSPDLSRTTRLPDLASPTISALMSSCLQEGAIAGLADQHALGLAAGEVEDLGRHQIVEQDDVGRAQRAHGLERQQLRIAGPGADQRDVTCSLAHCAGRAPRSSSAARRQIAVPSERGPAQRARRAANALPEPPPHRRARGRAGEISARHALAAAAQRAKPAGSSASMRERMAWPNTGAAPSVEMPTTSGERLTMAPNWKRAEARACRSR